MKKYLLVTGLLLALSSSPLRAEEPVAADTPVSEAEMKERLRLAADFDDIRPVRDQINVDVQRMANLLVAEERDDFMKYVQVRLSYDKLEELSIQTMAKIFTVPELKAMIAYYGSPEGKSADAKVPAYTAIIAPEVRKHLDAAVMDAKLGPQ